MDDNAAVDNCEPDVHLAIKRIQNAAFAEQLAEISKTVGKEFLTFGNEEEENFTWAKAADVLAGQFDGQSLDQMAFENLVEGASRCPDEKVQARFGIIFDRWRALHWPRLRHAVLSAAIAGLGHNGYLERAIDMWPALKSEPELRAQALHYAQRADRRIFPFAVANLALLTGSRADLRMIVHLAEGPSGMEAQVQVTELIKKWSADTVWGKLLLALWTGKDEGISETPLSQPVAVAVRMLREVPLRLSKGNSDVQLGAMSGASRMAWRRRLATAAEDDDELRDAIVEALLWFGIDAEDAFVQRAAIHIAGEHWSSVLRSLFDHPSSRADLRARSALDLLTGAVDPVENLALVEAHRHMDAPAFRGTSRTWLGDAQLEGLMAAAFASAATSLADEVRLTASAGEETLVARLFERLRGACLEVTKQAKILARETDRAERLRVKLDHRFVGKKEEGEGGLADDVRFSTDVTLIVKARSGSGHVLGERATLIQAKRMRRGGSPPDYEHYTVDLGQVRDIAKQTTSSFLLAVGPQSRGVVMPVIPARLFLDRFDEGQATKRLDVITMAVNGRSLADWLVDDVIGLWTGDPRERVIAKAREGGGDQATLLVEIEVALEPNTSAESR
jgi:hypothetical protein